MTMYGLKCEEYSLRPSIETETHAFTCECSLNRPKDITEITRTAYLFKSKS